MLTGVAVNLMKDGRFTCYINDSVKLLCPGVRVAFSGAVKKKTERRNFYGEGRWSVPGLAMLPPRVSWTAHRCPHCGYISYPKVRKSLAWEVRRIWAAGH